MSAPKAAKPVVAFATDEPRGVVCWPARDAESSTHLRDQQQAYLTRRCGVRPAIAGAIVDLAFTEARS